MWDTMHGKYVIFFMMMTSWRDLQDIYHVSGSQTRQPGCAFATDPFYSSSAACPLRQGTAHLVRVLHGTLRAVVLGKEKKHATKMRNSKKKNT